MKQSVSVVLVAYNRPKDLNEALESLLNQSVKPFEVIVIDDGSNPPLTIDFRSDNLKLIRFDKEVGLCRARNYGIRLAKGEYIAFMDDDAIAEKHWLEEIRKGFGVADILGGQIQPLYKALPPEWWNEQDFGFYAGVGNDWKNGEIWGCNMVIRKEVFRTIGFFNPRIGRGKGKLLNFEETDFFDRARRKGFDFQCVPAVVHHKVSPKRMTIRYIARWSYYDGKSRKVLAGIKPLKMCFDLLLCVLSLINPRTIISGKSFRIKKIALMAELLGRLF